MRTDFGQRHDVNQSNGARAPGTGVAPQGTEFVRESSLRGGVARILANAHEDG